LIALQLRIFVPNTTFDIASTVPICFTLVLLTNLCLQHLVVTNLLFAKIISGPACIILHPVFDQLILDNVYVVQYQTFASFLSKCG